MKTYKQEIIRTEDGHDTIYFPELKENYHSTHGAYNEAIHVFIESGLKHLDKEEVAVFEMGFGTGLNALETFLYGKENGKNIDYTSLELYPVAEELLTELNFVKDSSELQEIHAVKWNSSHDLNANFKLTKIQDDLLTVSLGESQFDLIFFDAFGPRIQPELWTEAVFQKIYKAMKPGGVLVTYCAQGQAKRNMKAAGLTVEGIPGPPGKREMIRATK